MQLLLERARAYLDTLEADRQPALTPSEQKADDVKLIKAFSNDKEPLVFTPKKSIPADAVTGSASGLDPHISPANAQIQAARVAKARGISVEQANQILAQFTESPGLGVLGEPRVNVLKLNLELDQKYPVKH